MGEKLIQENSALFFQWRFGASSLNIKTFACGWRSPAPRLFQVENDES